LFINPSREASKRTSLVIQALVSGREREGEGNRKGGRSGERKNNPELTVSGVLGKKERMRNRK